MPPKVSFVIPCYKLAHLLPECVNSILAQTYSDYEVLIMDDCSPDQTAEVAKGFSDPRVRLIRNDPNLGHLRNYNKGIELSQGEYIWLISADDCLRSPDILKRYVATMDANPKVGYVFCPSVGLENGRETGILRYSQCGDHDIVFNGREFLLHKLLKGNCVVAASSMVRKACYDTLGMFPLDLPYAGDWYLWCLFALRYDVAYFAEPMVCYRLHESSMTSSLVGTNVAVCTQDELAVPWRVMHDAAKFHLASVVQECEEVLAREYVLYLSGKHRMSPSALSMDDVAASLRQTAANVGESRRIRARVHAALADEAYEFGDHSRAAVEYRFSLEQNPAQMEVRFKSWLLRLGGLGTHVRAIIGAGRRVKGRARRILALIRHGALAGSQPSPEVK